jgi:hypothetical protein
MTKTKLNRQIKEQVYDLDKHGRLKFDFTGKPMKRDKIVGYEPPFGHQSREVEYRGVRMQIWVSPGQLINARKEYIRHVKKTGLNPLKLII